MVIDILAIVNLSTNGNGTNDILDADVLSSDILASDIFGRSIEKNHKLDWGSIGSTLRDGVSYCQAQAPNP